MTKNFTYEQDVDTIRKLHCPHCNVSLDFYNRDSENEVMTSFPPQYPMTCKCGKELRASRLPDFQTMKIHSEED